MGIRFISNPQTAIPSTRKRNWIRERKRLRNSNRRFNRKSVLKWQFGLMLLALVYVFLPDQLGSISVDYALGSPEEGGGFRRQLESYRNLAADCSTTNDTTTDESAGGSEFPEDLFTMEEKKNGWIILHILCIFYMFIGLAIVCDEYFESSLEAICADLNLREDVAGATFMAAGGSAPELFSSIIGVFIAKSDIGFGTIVGSATFNVLFVIAVCAFITTNLTLSWWPLTRDCVFYCCSIVVLVMCVIDQQVSTGEAVVLLLMYVAYITVMYFNADLEVWVGRRIERAKAPRTGWRVPLMNFLRSNVFNYFIYLAVIVNIVVIVLEIVDTETATTDVLNDLFSAIFITEMVLKMAAYDFFGYWHDPLNAFDGTLVVLILVELLIASSSFSSGLRALKGFRALRMARALRIVRLYYAYVVEKFDASTQTTEQDFEMVTSESVMSAPQQYIQSTPQIFGSSAVAPMPQPVSGFASKDDEVIGAEPVNGSGNDNQDNASGSGEEEEEEEEDEPANPFEIPDGGNLEKALWAISFPLSLGMWLTIPDCRRPIFQRFYFLTFTMCIVWIALLSYLMVWMCILFGQVADIPEPVMGLTLIAAGTSIPDLLSSVAVARRGFGDMAVSSSVGSNIFDILIGLPVPWFFSTAVIHPGTTVPIHSDGLTVMVLTLFLMVAAVISIIHWSDWVMSNRLGMAMVGLYFVFVAESLLLEYGILGGGC